jgi:hypothetical protein
VRGQKLFCRFLSQFFKNKSHAPTAFKKTVKRSQAKFIYQGKYLPDPISKGIIDTLRNWLCPIHGTLMEMMKDSYLRSINDSYLRNLSNNSGFSNENSAQEMYNCMYERRSFYESVFNDVETLMDHLFRIQRIAALIPNENAFIEYLRNLGKYAETIFVFKEETTSRGWYPPTSRISIHPTRYENAKTLHFRTIRDIIMGTTITILLSCFRPSEDSLKTGVELYIPFLNSLFGLNNGIMPIFTTNYDFLIEDIYSASDKIDNLITGAENGSSSEFTIKLQFDPTKKSKYIQTKYPVKSVSHRPFLKSNNKKIALFHLHGCANWFVDTESENIIQLDPREDLEYILPRCWFSNSLIPANIFPATVKDAYTLSPPFDIGYDYFSQVIIQAKILVIIGYSGRDETLKEILLWGAKKNEDIKFIIVGRGDQMSPHLSDVLPDNRIHYLSGGICKENDNVIKLCKSILKKK